MGLLRDTIYWSNVSNQMFKMRPPAGVPLSRQETIIFLGTACKALTDLISDHDLEKDLNLAANILHQNAPPPDLFSSGVRDFLGEFARAEIVLLLQSGMDFDAAVNLVRELRRAAEFAKDINAKTVSTLRERLEPLRDKTCKATSDERNFLDKEARTLHFWRVVKGCAAIGIDTIVGGGALLIDPVVIGPLTGMAVGGASIGYGTAMIMKAEDALSQDDR
jgi:hypothetical protein